LDWADSQELVDIYLAEVDERTSRLAPAARALASADLAGFEVESLVRDAHTLKGSSHMLGKLEIGSAAALLERGWKAVLNLGLEKTSQLGRGFEEVTSLLIETARDSGFRSRLSAATDQLSAALTELDEPIVVESPASGAGARPIEATSTVDVADASVAEPPVVEPTIIEPADPVHLHEGEKAAVEPLTQRAAPSNLGGLLGSLKDELSGSVTRVDTRELYRLINRAVELGLDADSLSDLTHVSFEGADPARLLTAWRDQLSRLSHGVEELQTWAVGLANVPMSDAVETYPQFVRFLARRLDREVRFGTSGMDLNIDRQIVDVLREPLRHLIVNAIAHGIESPDERLARGKQRAGSVRLEAHGQDDRLVIVVSDDGRGVDWDAVAAAAATRGLGLQRSELMAHLFRPGFTTVWEPNDFSGTGEGLTLVADSVDRIGGSVVVDSTPGVGTKVRLDVPVSLVLQNVVIVASGDQFFGIAEPAVKGMISLESSAVRFGEYGRELVHDGETVPIVSFSKALGLPGNPLENSGLVLNTRFGLVAVSVTEIVDRRRVAVKTLGPILEGADHLTGAAFLGGGEVLVVVDHNHLGAQARRPEEMQGVKPRVLVVDDSAGVRQLIAASLRGRGFEVTVSSNARDAVRELARSHFDVLIIDYMMPRSNGTELVRALRKNGIVQPVVMVSGVADESEKAAAWEAGVDAYLDKYDLRRGSLATTVRRLLEAGNGREPR
jgi:chemotaxis protein histidine kinase CheA